MVPMEFFVVKYQMLFIRIPNLIPRADLYSREHLPKPIKIQLSSERTKVAVAEVARDTIAC